MLKEMAKHFKSRIWQKFIEFARQTNGLASNFLSVFSFLYYIEVKHSDNCLCVVG